MPKLIPAAKRIVRNRELIQQARNLPIPQTGPGKSDFSYTANVEDLPRQARDMVRFIPLQAVVQYEWKPDPGTTSQKEVQP